MRTLFGRPAAVLLVLIHWILAFSLANCEAAQAPLTTTRSVQQLTPEQANEHPAAKIRGVVTYVSESMRLLFVEDATGGLYCEPATTLRLPKRSC